MIQRMPIMHEQISLPPILEQMLLETKLPAFASSIFRRHEPSRSSPGSELRMTAGHGHNAAIHRQ